jgi:hypothetical protein
MVSNQHIRRKKRKEKNLDVKLLTTNRTTVPPPPLLYMYSRVFKYFYLVCKVLLVCSFVVSSIEGAAVEPCHTMHLSIEICTPPIAKISNYSRPRALANKKLL